MGRLREIAVITVVFIVLGHSARGQLGDAQVAVQPTYSPGQVNLESSRAYVFVGKTGFGHEHGVAGLLKQGALNLEAGTGRLIFDMASFQADSDVARQYVGLSGSTDVSTKQQVNANMHGAKVLDVGKYPTATFLLESSQLLPAKSKRGFSQYRLDGKFTLHGVSQPISLVAEAEPKNGWIHLRGGFTILQTSYAIKPFSKVFGAVGITDQLKIWGDLWIAGT